jgi:hypothetical protein
MFLSVELSLAVIIKMEVLPLHKQVYKNNSQHVSVQIGHFQVIFGEYAIDYWIHTWGGLLGFLQEGTDKWARPDAKHSG